MTQEELLAAMVAGVDRGAVDLTTEGEEDERNERYIDWSCAPEDGSGRSFEFHTDGETFHMDLTWEQITRLQQALTVLLLELTGGAA
jgi:hypothetical protein